MTKQPTCTDRQHVWSEPFTDGDTCACGRFYLTKHPDRVYPLAAVITETPEPPPEPQ